MSAEPAHHLDDQPILDPSSLPREDVEGLTEDAAKTVLQHSRQELRQSQRRGDKGRTASALLGMARALRVQHQFDPAMRLLEEARQMYANQSHIAGLASVYDEMSLLNRNLNRNALALEYANKAVELLRPLGRSLLLAWAYDNLSVIRFRRFERQESLIYARRARSLFTEFNSESGLAWNGCHLGDHYRDMGYYQRASRLYAESLTLFTKRDVRRGMARAMAGLASVDRLRTRLAPAQTQLTEANNLFEEESLLEGQAYCLLEEAALQRTLGDTDASLQKSKRAGQILGPLRHPSGLGWAFLRSAQALKDSGHLLKAWQNARKALSLFGEGNNRMGAGWAELEIGLIYLELGDLPHARESLHRARSVGKELLAAALGMEAARGEAAFLYAEGSLRPSLALSTQAETRARRLFDAESLASTLLLKSSLLFCLKEPVEAARCMDEARSLIMTYALHRLRPSLGLYWADHLMGAGQESEARQVLMQTAHMAEERDQGRILFEARIGLLLLNAPTPERDVPPMPGEREIRSVGSKALKARALLARGVYELETDTTMGTRLLLQAVQVARNAGLTLLEQFILNAAAEASRAAGALESAREFQSALRRQVEKGPLDLHLARASRAASSAHRRWWVPLSL